MPIVQSRIVSNTRAGPGRISVVEEHTDSQGKKYFARYKAPALFEVNTALANRANQITRELAGNETSNSVERVRRGEDSLVVADDSRQSSKEAISRELVREAMDSNDLDLMIALEPLLDDIRDNRTEQGAASFLDVTIQQLTRILRRSDNVHDNPPTTPRSLAVLFARYKNQREELDG